MSDQEPLVDRPHLSPVTSSRVVYDGRVWDVWEETFDLGAAGSLTRDLQMHPGAVSVLALDDDDRVLLIQQYRHPIGMFEWELPAGLLDVPDEPLVETARRELHEEADVRAEEWHTLVDYYSSPGGSSEALRIFLARGLSEVPEDERHERDAEELGMPVRWVPLDEARQAVLDGRVHNPALIIGVLGAHAMRATGWSQLRPADAPWLPVRR